MRRLLLVLLLLLAACGSRPGDIPRLVRPGINVISRDEINGERASDVLALIQRIRPHWLGLATPTSVDVFLEGRHVGGARDLRYYSPEELDGIEYLTAAQAQTRFIESRGNPAIILIPRER
jgi:hypothetical protein